MKSIEVLGIPVTHDTESGLWSLSGLTDSLNFSLELNRNRIFTVTETITRFEIVEKIFFAIRNHSINGRKLIVSEERYLNDVEKIGIISTLKRIGAYKVTGVGESKTIWTVPVIWVLLASHASPVLMAKLLLSTDIPNSDFNLGDINDTVNHSFKKTYLMIDNHSGLYKIGSSKKPAFREQTLQSDNPSIDLLLVIEADVERSLHKYFAEKRVRGEWFQLSKSDLEYLENIRNLVNNNYE